VKLPSTVNILSVPYTVEIGPLADPSDFGESNGSERTIRIRDTSPFHPSTLLHEICHQVLYVSGLTNLLTDELEEAIVTALEHGLFPYFRIPK